jgi:hypothetical protein
MYKFCPFKEFYIFSNCGHLWWRSELSDRFWKRTTTSRFSTVLSNWKLSLVLISTICIFMSQKRINVLPQEMLHVKILLKCNYIVLFKFKNIWWGNGGFIKSVGVFNPYVLFIVTSSHVEWLVGSLDIILKVDTLGKPCLKLAQWFQRKRFLK